MKTPDKKKSKVIDTSVDEPKTIVTKTLEQPSIKLSELGNETITKTSAHSPIKLSGLGNETITKTSAHSPIKLSGLGKETITKTAAQTLINLSGYGDELLVSKTGLTVSQSTLNTLANIKNLKYFESIDPSIFNTTKSSLGSNWESFTRPSSDNQMKLTEEITTLKRKLVTITKQLTDKEEDSQKTVNELNMLNSELQIKEKINHILPRIHEDARVKLIESAEFLELFTDAKSCEAVVVSIDIRRSTELMLKARKPELFSKFITELSSKLSKNIISNYGVFDKFTGDGILAFFPKFYSGDEAMIRALKSTEECHRIFDEHYHQSKSCFNVFIKDVGLGIGVDYGTVTLVNNSNELTVVGIPVVYACRMSSAPAGETLLNQPAKEEIERLCVNQIKLTETTLLIKNEGTAEVYKVDVNPSVYNSLPSLIWNTIQNEAIEDLPKNVEN